MNSVGEYLRKVREQRKVPIAQVARDTKISEKYIVAIEQGEFSRLPAPTYAKGFVKIYAEYLGIDPDAVVDQFLKEHVGISKQAFSIEADTVATSLASGSWRHTALGLGAAAVVVIVIAGGVALWRSCFHPSAIELGERTEELETFPIPPLPTVKPEVKTVVEEPSADAPPGEKKMKLVARAKKDSVWMRVYVDKVLLFEGTIPRGKEEFWLADERIHLRMGKPGAVEFFLNGEPLEITGGRKERNLIIEKGGKITFYKGKMREEPQ